MFLESNLRCLISFMKPKGLVGAKNRAGLVVELLMDSLGKNFSYNIIVIEL